MDPSDSAKKWPRWFFYSLAFHGLLLLLVFTLGGSKQLASAPPAAPSATEAKPVSKAEAQPQKSGAKAEPQAAKAEQKPAVKADPIQQVRDAKAESFRAKVEQLQSAQKEMVKIRSEKLSDVKVSQSQASTNAAPLAIQAIQKSTAAQEKALAAQERTAKLDEALRDSLKKMITLAQEPELTPKDEEFQKLSDQLKKQLEESRATQSETSRAQNEAYQAQSFARQKMEFAAPGEPADTLKKSLEEAQNSQSQAEKAQSEISGNPGALAEKIEKLQKAWEATASREQKAKTLHANVGDPTQPQVDPQIIKNADVDLEQVRKAVPQAASELSAHLDSTQNAQSGAQSLQKAAHEVMQKVLQQTNSISTSSLRPDRSDPTQRVPLTPAPTPEAEMDLSNKSLSELYQLARILEKQNTDLYRELQAARTAMMQEIPFSQALSITPSLQPKRDSLSLDAVESFDGDPTQGGLAHAQLSQAEQQLNAISQFSSDLLTQTRTKQAGPAFGYSSPNKEYSEPSSEQSKGGYFNRTAADGSVAPPVIPPEEILNSNAPGRRLSSALSGDKWLFLDSWYTVGPFPNVNRENRDKAFPPELVFDLDGVYVGKDSQTIRWEFLQSAKVAITPNHPTHEAVYYAYSEIWLEQPMTLLVSVGADDALKLWINDSQVYESGDRLKPWNPSETVLRVPFPQGRSRILMRIENGPLSVQYSCALKRADL